MYSCLNDILFYQGNALANAADDYFTQEEERKELNNKEESGLDDGVNDSQVKVHLSKASTRNDAKDGFLDGDIDSKLPLTAILDNFFNDNTKVVTEDLLELKSADDFSRLALSINYITYCVC